VSDVSKIREVRVSYGSEVVGVGSVGFEAVCTVGKLTFVGGTYLPLLFRDVDICEQIRDVDICEQIHTAL
jgi:hypothetical protein